MTAPDQKNRRPYTEDMEDILHKIRYASYAGEYSYYADYAAKYLSRIPPKTLTPKELALAHELCSAANCKMPKNL